MVPAENDFAVTKRNAQHGTENDAQQDSQV
jgi:hypothetical protein